MLEKITKEKNMDKKISNIGKYNFDLHDDLIALKNGSKVFERFMPKNGQAYYHVEYKCGKIKISKSEWEDAGIDSTRWHNENCFKSSRAANEALKISLKKRMVTVMKVLGYPIDKNKGLR